MTITADRELTESLAMCLITTELLYVGLPKVASKLNTAFRASNLAGVLAKLDLLDLSPIEESTLIDVLKQHIGEDKLQPALMKLDRIRDEQWIVSDIAHDLNELGYPEVATEIELIYILKGFEEMAARFFDYNLDEHALCALKNVFKKHLPLRSLVRALLPDTDINVGVESKPSQVAENHPALVMVA